MTSEVGGAIQSGVYFFSHAHISVCACLFMPALLFPVKKCVYGLFDLADI